MISIQLVSIIQALLVLCTPSLSYPVFGTKRYNNVRSPGMHFVNDNYSWGTPVIEYQQYPAAQRAPLNYYDMYPYSQEYQDDYYPVNEPMSYPVYVPGPRTSKYEVYQAVLPYYYGQRALPRQNYGSYGYQRSSDPLYDLEKEMKQETEFEQRHQAQPIDKEVLYDNNGVDDENVNDINAAFVQNLIMSQMYQDTDKQKDYYDTDDSNTDYYYDENNYGRWENAPTSPELPYKEDEDVRELKQLAKIQKPTNKIKTGPTAEERMKHFRMEKQKVSNENNNLETKRDTHRANRKEEVGKYGTVVYATNDLAFSDRKPMFAVSTTSAPLPKIVMKSQRKNNNDGQKEEVLARPATPVRRPFSAAQYERSNGEYERKREPSVFDTIKHMLDMEKSLEKNNRVADFRPPMRKRIVSSEDSLIHQLSVLKKAE